LLRTFRRASLLAILSLGAFALGSGCGDRPGASQSGVGSISVALLDGGVTLNAVGYMISGPSGFTQNGSLNVSASASITALIGGLPAGGGYSIALTATGTDGTTTCAGSAMFAVTANTVTQVSVALDCHQPARTGSIAINGTINVCPAVQMLSCLPATVNVGGTAALTATGQDVDSGPSPLTYSWTASNGTLTGAATATPTWTCTTAGTATITVTISDGDTTAGCPATGSVQVNCSM
jgi:hypothetical protein